MRILLADDHPLLTSGVRQVLEREPGFEIVGEAHSGPEVVPLVTRFEPDVVLLDLRMPGLDGLLCLDRIQARRPETKVVVLSMSSDPLQIQSAFEHGARGYILKTIDPGDLASAIRQAVDGTGFHAAGLPVFDEAHAAAPSLTGQELTILRLVAHGESNGAIARRLWLSEQTIKFHLSRIYRKLDVSNRTQAASWAHEHGLVVNESQILGG